MAWSESSVDTIEAKLREPHVQPGVDARRREGSARAHVADRTDRSTEAQSPPPDNTDPAMLHWLPLVIPLLAAFICAMGALIWWAVLY